MRPAAALLVAAFTAVAIGIALAFGFGGLSPLVSALALVGGTITGTLALQQMPRKQPDFRRIHPAEWLLFGIFTLASLRAFLWLLYIKNNEFHVLSPNNLGDLPLHLDLIRYLASGVRFWPESPIFAGETLKYPIGADLFNSLLLRAGLPVEQGLVWVGLTACALTAAALWRWGRGFAVAAFLFGSGLAGFALLRDFAAISAEPVPDFQATDTWKNPFLALFVTQRGLLFALPAGLFLLDHWRMRYLRDGRALLPDWTAWLLYSALPLFNVHAFLYLSIALAGMFVFARDAASRQQSARFVAMAFLPATLCAALVTGGFSADGGVHWEPGWMQTSEEGVGPAWFWLRNFGLYLVLSAALTVVAILRGPRETRAIVLPATFMFIVCAFVSFAPWPWDNTKLLLWCWLAVAPCLWSDLLRPLQMPARVVVCFILFLTGAVSLYAGLDERHDYKIIDVPHVRATAEAVRNLDPNARFACAPEYSHPLLMLGRKITVGYPGHLWSHGTTYRGRNHDKLLEFQNLMMGGPSWQESARKLDVNYIYWGAHEKDAFPESTKPWEATLPIVGKGDDFAIYALPHLRTCEIIPPIIPHWESAKASWTRYDDPLRLGHISLGVTGFQNNDIPPLVKPDPQGERSVRSHRESPGNFSIFHLQIHESDPAYPATNQDHFPARTDGLF